MSNPDAMSKLVSCLELAFRESAGARKALREWLDELDRVDNAKTRSSSPAGPPSPKKESQPSTHTQGKEMGVSYYGVRSFHNLDPEDYKWISQGGNERSRVVYFERDLPSGLVCMRYYYTTGTIQLIYNNRNYYSESSGDEDYYICDACRKEPRRIQETFKGLDLEEFLKLVRNPPTFYGKGYR